MRRGLLVGLVGLLFVAAVPQVRAAPAPKMPRGPSSLLFVPSFGSNAVTVVDLTDNHIVKTIGIRSRGACCAYATPDGSKVLVVDGLEPYVSTIDVRKLAVTKVTRLAGVWGDQGVPIQRDGKRFWVSSIPDGALESIDPRTGRIVNSYPFMSSKYTITHDGKTLFTANLTSPSGVIAVTSTTLDVRSPETGKVLASISLPLSADPVPEQLYVTPGDTKLYVQHFGPNGVVYVIDIRDRLHPRHVKTVNVGSVPIVGTFTPDGRQLWFPNSGDGTIAVWDVATDRVVRKIPLGEYAAGVAFAGDRAYVLVAPGSKPLGVLAMPEIFAALMPGGFVNPPTGSFAHHPLYEQPGAIYTYDATTYRRLPLAPIRLPSLAHIGDVVPKP